MTADDERLLALVRTGVMPGVEPDSSEGRHYARLIEHSRQVVAAAPLPSDETKRRVLVLLGGGHGTR